MRDLNFIYFFLISAESCLWWDNSQLQKVSEAYTERKVNNIQNCQKIIPSYLSNRETIIQLTFYYVWNTKEDGQILEYMLIGLENLHNISQKSIYYSFVDLYTCERERKKVYIKEKDVYFVNDLKST